MGLKVTNNAFGTLNAGINSSATTIVLTAGQGARFPTLSAGDYFYATLIDTSNNLEIVKVTARSTDTMTVVRGQDNTTARAYSTNDRFELRPTAALFNEIATAAEAALPKAGGTITGDLTLTGTVGDGNPAMRFNVTSDNNSYNWTESQLASNMTANTHLVQLIGKAESNLNSAFLGYRHSSDGSSANQGVMGLYGKNNIITFDGLGRVRKQYQPFFYAKNGSESGDGITTSPAVFTSIVQNIGGHFATSGAGAYSRFTAPVDGVYFFTGNPGYKQSGVDFAVRLRINGTDLTDVIRFIGSPSSHSGISFGITIYLSANDYVDINMAAAGVLQYHRNNSGVPNWFSGGLLF